MSIDGLDDMDHWSRIRNNTQSLVGLNNIVRRRVFLSVHSRKCLNGWKCVKLELSFTLIVQKSVLDFFITKIIFLIFS